MHSYRLRPLAAMLLLGLAVMGTACNKSDTDAAKAASAAAASTPARARPPARRQPVRQPARYRRPTCW